ncbi:MAG: YggS family pyridoxal phosphate-dependent enzyme [Eubacteriales bacterium]|nr:YggS family pyridoxal phosphate-dependent enzyme [Eubacteriales bacterium]
MDIERNLATVQRNIEAAAKKAGREASDIILVGATKMNDAEAIQRAIRAGLMYCGENRVQEMLEKEGQGAYKGAHLHFVGHLQTNKVKNVVGLAELIHSVDSPELMDCISKAAIAKGVVQNILIEINAAGEESKSGFAPGDFASAIIHAASLEGIKVRGVMAVPPICESGEENRPYFKLVQQLFIDNSEKKYDNVCMDFLSIGMSGDYMTAIECGANMIRIGSAIFGPRNYRL